MKTFSEDDSLRCTKIEKGSFASAFITEKPFLNTLIGADCKVLISTKLPLDMTKTYKVTLEEVKS
jgi:hypothetical protein